MAITESTLPASPTLLEVTLLLPDGASQPVVVIQGAAPEDGETPVSQVIRSDEACAVFFSQMIDDLIEFQDPGMAMQIAAYLKYQSERLTVAANQQVLAMSEQAQFDAAPIA